MNCRLGNSLRAGGCATLEGCQALEDANESFSRVFENGRCWMILSSAKARRVLDDAVRLLPDSQQRARWRRWSAEHPQTLQPGGAPADDCGPLPHDIVAIALAALGAKASQLRAERNEAAEDEAFAFDNNLSLIRSIETMLLVL